MKNKYLKIIVMMVFLLGLTGCTKTFVHDGKSYKKNILCRPEKQETIKIYEENNINIENLKSCSEFKITDGGYEGLWKTIFVKPLAFLLLKVGSILKSYGLSIIAVTLLLRALVLPITINSTTQSINMNKAQREIERINKKYANKTDTESLMKKSQEQLMIYKKYNIKPLSGCLFALIQIPLFFAFFEAINRLPVLFEENFMGLFELRRTPMEAFSMNQFYYLIIVILIVVTTYLSFKLNKNVPTTEEQEKQMKLMSNIMTIMIAILSFNLPVGLGLYWIFNSSFTIIQNIIMKKIIKEAK